MEKKNNNPEREAKDREFYEMMQVKWWLINQHSLRRNFFRTLTCSQQRGCTASSPRRGS